MNNNHFKTRLKEAMKGQSNRLFADKCAISEGTLRRYLMGDTFPPLDTLEAIAEVAGVSLAWLASGEAPIQRGIEHHLKLDEDILEKVIEAIEEYLVEAQICLAPGKKAQLVGALYEMYVEEKETGKDLDKARVLRLIKLAV